MSGRLSSVLCTSAFLLAGGVGFSTLATPASAQVGIRIGFDYFHDRLSHDGRWIRHPVWGDVWRPRRALAGADFQPYVNGYWELTDEYGWYWVSDDPFDDVVYHYGRWVYDPDYDWLWVPGYTWAPAWVVWREGDDYTGWAPLPPDAAFVSGAGLSFGVSLGPIAVNFYDRWYGGRVDPSRFFVFVNNRHLVDRNYRRFIVPRDRVKIVLGRTRDVTKFEIANGRVVNRGINVRIVERAAGRRIAPVSFKTVVKPNAPITTVNEAKQIRQRERAAHPIDTDAVRRGARGGNPMGAEDRGNKRSNPSGTEKENGDSNAETMGGPGNSQANGRNRGGGESTMTGPNENSGATGDSGRSRNRGNNENGTAAGSQSNGPAGEEPSPRPHNSKGAGPSAAPAGATNGPAPGESSGTGAKGSESGATPVRPRRPSPAGSMNGPAAGNGNATENAGTDQAPPARQKAQPAQPGSGDAERKNKRKPKNEPSNTPQQ